MTTGSSQLVIGTLLYSVKFENLDDELVDRRARALIEEPLVELRPIDEYEAIVEALQSSAKLTEVIRLPEFIPEPHSEQDFRDFLRRLTERLDAMRPWPEPQHRELHDSRWSDYDGARVVGRIKMDYVDAQQRINYGFRGVMDRGHKVRVLILHLKSGDEVALVTPWWSGSEEVAILSGSIHRRPAEVLEALIDATRFTSEEVAQWNEDDSANCSGAR